MKNLPETFGCMSFNEKAMQEYLPAETYLAVKRAMAGIEPMDITTANAVAEAMKNWAIEKGVTHYTHWFQPQTGVTAEKHDSFISPTSDGGVIMKFSGKELIKGETDASSFPSGGLRATFEARGYTAWDSTSYAFIKDNVLCIPTAFCSYGGHALDKKTPLLRSMEALNKQAQRVLRLFGTQCGQVYPTVGLEQEYFLVDKEDFDKRKDLIYTGRTLFGAKPPKGQELDDHYFGSIKLRVSAFMKDLNEELWRLGILAKTEHNEVAPAQHELAPIHCKCNVAVDHNQITMEIMRKVAKRHGLTCLLHEKPFDGVNGSGKHNNWSLSTDTGLNLLEPGDTPEKNAQFLTFLCAIIRAVDEYQDLIRISVASAGNDHRLGMSEAPPAIVSVYVGDELEAVLKAVGSDTPYDRKSQDFLRICSSSLPAIPKDNSDRNRTSPMAFTGNKFELRMLGSSMSAADCNTVLNTIVAESLSMFADALEGAVDFHDTLYEILRDCIKRHDRIIFSGNGYDDSWPVEAEKRGLSNYRSSADAIPHLLDEKNVELFQRHGVYTRVELAALTDILLEGYSKQLNIEALVSAEMVRRDIQPAVLEFQRRLAEVISSKRAVSQALPCRPETELLERTAALSDDLYEKRIALEAAVHEARAIAEPLDCALAYRKIVLPAMSELRHCADTLEGMISKDVWPYPSYGSLLYRV